MTSKIYRIGGGTNFDAPLKDAHNICQKLGDETSEIFFYFMTDGASTYPDNAVKTIKNSKYISKVEFLGVGFGHGTFPVIE